MDKAIRQTSSPQPDQRLIDMVNAHVRAEVDGDMDAVLATLCPEPHYECHPLGMTMTDISTIAEFYRRCGSMFAKIKIVGESGTFGDGNAGKYFGTNGIVTWDHGTLTGSDGGEIVIKCLALFELDAASGLLKGEKMFFNDGAAGLFTELLGDDFRALPGVSFKSSAA